jgi:hypothetical protein
MAEWTLAERGRLRAGTAESLRTLTQMAANAHDLEKAAEHLGRLAESSERSLASAWREPSR